MKRILCSLLSLTMAVSMLGSYALADDVDDLSSDSSETAVEQSDEKNIEDCEVSGVVDKTYTGSAVEQSIVVKDGNLVLVEDRDYSVSYVNNVNPGIAKIIVIGCGDYTGSLEISFEIKEKVTVNTVTNFKSVYNTTNTIKLSWEKVSGAEGYIVYNYDNSKKTWVRIEKTSTTDNTYSLLNLPSGTAYKFAIKAYRTVDGKEVVSPSFPRLSTATLPGKVTNLVQKDLTTSGYTLSWNKVSGATEYYVFKYNKSTKKYDDIAHTSTNSCKVKNIAAATKDTYIVRAVKVYDGVNYYGENVKSIAFVTRPAQVKTTKTSVDRTSLKITWSKVTNAEGYQIYYSTSKDSGYKLLKQINDSKTLSYTTKALSGKRVYIKVRAYVRDGNKKGYVGVCSSLKLVRVFANKTYNQVINSYKNSNSVTLVNGQGYTISASKKKELTSALTCLGGTESFVLLDLDSGAMVGYNSKSYMGTASTVKMPYMLYVLKKMESGTPTMNTKLTYKKSDYSDGSGVIKNSKFGTQFTLKSVFHNICAYSDNCGYYMLQDYFGYAGYNKYIASLGCKTSVSASTRWGVVSAADSAREWIQMYDYLYNGKYGSFMRDELKKSTSSNFRIGLKGKYTVYSKCGWTDNYHHDTAVVEAEHPYVLICLTNRVSASRLQRVARAADAIHTEMWNYYNK